MFRAFGSSHWGAMAAVAIVAALLCFVGRRGPLAARTIRILLGTLLTALTVSFLVEQNLDPDRRWPQYAPFQLCDLAVLAGIIALFTANVVAFELLYFWGLSGTLLATITPDVAADFPAAEFVDYFLFHGTVIVAALFLAVGARLRPRPGAPWRMLVITNAYAAVVAVVNLVSDSNFLYLRRKPQAPTLLDWFGPWPVYILVVEVVALALFTALYLPFAPNGRWRRRSDPGRADAGAGTGKAP